MINENELAAGSPLNRTELRSRLIELEQKIGRLDAAKLTGPELDRLHAEYEKLQEEIRKTDHQDLQAAA